MTTQEKLRSDSLNLLRFPLAMVVLIIHIFSSGGILVQGKPVSLDSVPVFLKINYFIDGFLRGQSVPIYFFISGYVFFLGVTLTKEKYLQKLSNRVKTLLIPYLIWNTFAFLLTLFYSSSLSQSLFPTHIPEEVNLSFIGILSYYWDTYPVNTPLWFIRDLMIVVLLTPAIYWILKRTRHYFICLLGLAWFIFPSLWNIPRLSPLLSAFFFFSWGAYMSINHKDMLVEFGRFSRLSAVLYVTLSLSYIAAVHWWPDATKTIKAMNIIAGLYFAYNLSSWLLRKKICRPNAFLASASFFIYVSHFLICGKLLKILFVYLQPTTDIEFLAVYVLDVVITTSVLLLTFWGMRQYTPGILKILTGRK